MNPLRLKCILPLWVILSGTLQCQNIFVVGVSKPDRCAFATKPLIQDLNGIGFPKDWTFAVACSQTAWRALQRKWDTFGTGTAFTNLEGRITILNGTIYLQSLPLRGTIHRTPRIVLEHEYGHIICRCADEAKADKAAGLGDSRHGASNRAGWALNPLVQSKN